MIFLIAQQAIEAMKAWLFAYFALCGVILLFKLSKYIYKSFRRH
jgi:hypothetical protein